MKCNAGRIGASRIIAAFGLAGLCSLPPDAARAQDVPGIEICSRESRLDRRTGCLQSNVEYLQQVINRNALDAREKLTAATRDIAALKEQLAGAIRDIVTLKESLAAAQARLDQFKAPASGTTAPKVEPKPPGK
jgi:hypothetical protein